MEKPKSQNRAVAAQYFRNARPIKIIRDASREFIPPGGHCG